jgi:hypothetical protein
MIKNWYNYTIYIWNHAIYICKDILKIIYNSKKNYNSKIIVIM